MSADCQIRIGEIEADVIGWYRSLFSEHPDDGPHPVSVNRLHLVDVCTGMRASHERVVAHVFCDDGKERLMSAYAASGDAPDFSVEYFGRLSDLSSSADPFVRSWAEI